ncbi:4Fe-4S binding protein [candidate division KSB1 bacterium]|nr:4Fe-4S binding protein [candidate division KSB1 bacterium]
MILTRAERCPQNHPCPVLRSCPVGAISQHGYSAPVIDEEKCIDCGKCVKLCSVFTTADSYQKVF